MTRVLAAAAMLVVASTTVSTAASTPWQEVSPGVRLRLISSDILKADGTTMVALEVDMPPDTKTYWRVPGESGIPTRIDTGQSDGVAGGEVLWPLPQVDTSAGMVDFVYYGPTVLPLSVKVSGKSATLAAKVDMGVCSDICVPVSASLTLPLGFARADHSEGLRIAQAMSQVPIPWNGGDDPIGTVDYDKSTGTLSVEVTDDRVQPETLLADAGLGDTFFGAPQKSPDGQVVTLPLLGPADDVDLAGRDVTLSFMTADGPYVVTRTVADGGSTPPGR